MANASPDLERRIADIAADRVSGAADLLDRAIAVLADALSTGAAIRPVAAAICRAQPSMASMWTAALEAIASEQTPGRFERFAQRVARSPAALQRVGVDHLASGIGDPSSPIRLVTVSNSRSVTGVVQALHERLPVQVSCSESRPALEGRRLAAALATHGVHVTCFSDAAIAHALAAADAVIVGADAVAPSWFLNKSGTRMLAAAASLHGVPVYVVASRDKFVADAVAARLVVADGPPQDIWDAPPPGVTVRNPCFEATPLDLVTAVITDMGVLGADMVADVCRAIHDAATLEALKDL